MKKALILILTSICFVQCNSSTDTKDSKNKKTEQNITKENNSEEFLTEVNSTVNKDTVKIKEDTKIYDIDSIDVKPDFDKGIAKLHKFIRNNYKYPDEELQVKGIVDVNFVVEKDGTLTDITVTKDADYGTGKEAIRILKKCPKWFPGTQNNKLVRVRYYLTIPIHVYHEQAP
ncbi:energy transducer TonB [Flavobacterium sp. KACC 22758]|uniref:energy transducer TonB n=1 Tax=Flavobacterium sp. KACC 22758 TaxID=3025667 RepID=UPI002366A78A|nr:energy transducer TonB [Flavobacterium sp. KACC 22758]WDF58809.1 energy transducer TonB [Flavobacterium sp. KACC 22758]